MDAQNFLAEFGHLANAPGGVGKLRELVLQLAVSGDLTIAETPIDAAPLLETIEKQKRDHPERKKVIPKQPYSSRELIKAPNHWIICRLGDLALTIIGGGTPSKNNPAYWGGDIPWASVKDMKELKYLDDTEDHITLEGLNSSSSNLIPPGRVIVCTRMGLGKVAINRIAIAINQDLKALELPKEVNADFFLILYRTRELKGTGTTVSGIKQDQLLALPAALPPLEEQARIVAKVDELMALCDKLEAQQQTRRKIQNNLRQSTLQAVATSQSPHELQTNWTRLAGNFGQLNDAPEDVDEMLGALKTLAVRGLLVKASSTPPNLDSIKADCIKLREKYISDGLMRRQKQVDMADAAEIYPDHWAVAAFDELAVVIGGVTKGRNLRGRQMIVCPYLAVANVQRGYFKLENLKTIEIASDELAKYQVSEGDLLITEGGDWDKVGRTAIWRGGAMNCLHQNHVFKARVPSAHLLNDWVELVFNSDIGRNYFAGASKQTTNLASINMTQLRSFPIPIPPIDEQRRILSMLARLGNRCGEWRSQLKKKHSLARVLADAVVSGFTGIAIEKEEEPMKAPQTELIAMLHLDNPPGIKDQAPLATILARHNGVMRAKDLWQRFGSEIDVFYAQLKIEVAQGWIQKPAPAVMREKPTDMVNA
ncbi:restriction endonuclease subunit S [Limnohabitans sp. T6-20]|uniref:restriction endonuclease subunit S n=1 Tax=Limnohabitans sp. T6-20 TaxID=1100725 RepID=UPI000D38C9FB|nr:restriction endonuclease subunit S [Limnohabitans sp. T6-20]PUE07963.1 type I restriction endonuclease subunit R [Limnohabitans sp. T6-20]